MNADRSTRSTSSRDRVVRTRRRPDLSHATLSEADRHLLDVLCRHRVVRQDQLARLLPDVRERTLRYRTRRLHDLGLMGRTRPYRERGSAPNHHWPTRRADCMMNGDPLPRGGERREPNPLFLAHAAGLTELYVTLATDGPGIGLSLLEYRREADAREPFKHLGKQRALAPDAFVVLGDERKRELEAFVELDLGTMSHARLREKANLYAAYTAASVWREQHPYLPALLFLTTTEARALRFLDSLDAAFAENRRRDYGRRVLVVGAGALAFQPNRLLAEPCLMGLEGPEKLRLLDVLEEARAPYEQAERVNRKRREAWQRKHTRLHEDPKFARRALERFTSSHSGYLEALDPVERQAVNLLAASNGELSPQERDALRTLVGDLDTALINPGSNHPSPPGGETIRAIAALADAYRERQQHIVERLTVGNGDGPHLRRARRTLNEGALLSHPTVAQLPNDAASDARGREQQQRRRRAYLAWREAAARALVRRTGPLARLAHSPEEFYDQLDRDYLRTCRSCEEIVYPDVDPAPARVSEVQAACHYCQRSPDDTGTRVVYLSPSEGGCL